MERTTVMRWERGETTPQPWARPKLARALDISDQALSELLGEPAEPESAVSSAAGPLAHMRDEPRWGLAAGAPGGSSEDMMRRNLLRLLIMIGVLVTMPNTDEQLDQLDCPSITSGRFDNVTVDDYAALNEHMWRVFVMSKSKGAVLPLVHDQLDVLIFSLNQSQQISTHRQLCALISELLQTGGRDLL